MSDIPVIEFDALVAGSAGVADALELGLGELGVVYVHGHPLARENVLDLYDHFLEILARPTAEKGRWGGRQIWFQRGWTPPNTEQAVLAGGAPDFKECFFAAPLPLDPRCQQSWPQVYADNVWPAEARAFREAMLGIGVQLHDIGLGLLRACAGVLGQDPKLLVAATSGAAHVSRLLKYLPLDAHQVRQPGGVLWGEEHTDFNVLTLLPGGCFYRDGRRGSRPQDSGGLVLRTRPTTAHPTGMRLPGRPPEGCVVAQVGQQLEVLSAGRFLATPHAIEAPSEPGWVRTSLAHFVHLNGRERVEPLPGLPEADGYGPPVLAGTYATKTLIDIGLAPPEALQQLGYRHYDRLKRLRAIDGAQ